MNGAFLEGLRAGAKATAVVSAVERIEVKLLRRQPVYSPKRIARRATGAAGGEKLGPALRSVYGPMLGLAWRLVPGWRRLPLPWGGLVVGIGTFLFEAAALPRFGMSPPWRKWSGGEKLGLLAHSLAFGFALSPRLRYPPSAKPAS